MQDDAWLLVESLDLEGQGVAHRSDGKVVFIEGALPGERVQELIARTLNVPQAVRERAKLAFGR